MATDNRGPDPEVAARDQPFRALVEHSVDAVAIVNPAATVEYVSPSIERVLGCRPEDLTGEDAFARIHPEEVDEVRRRFGALLQAPGTSSTVATRLRHENGSWRWVESRLSNLLED